MELFLVNAADVIFETIDDEIILIHLRTGNYFSIDGTGRAVWALLAQPQTLDSIVGQLALRYAADAATLRAGVQPFIADLLAQELIVRCVDAPAASAPPTINGTAADRLPFTPPQLQTFSDMQDLLLLDPIHDVDAMGWPHPKVGNG